jgi:hypothetical protein
VKILFGILLLAIFSACTVVNSRGAPVPAVTAQPSPPPAPSPAPSAGQSTTWNAQIGLAPYLNSTLVDYSSERDGSSKVVFESRADFDDIYAYVHQQLSSKGWQRTALDYKSKATKLEATYRQNGRDFRLKFDAEGKSGRFKLEFNF